MCASVSASGRVRCPVAVRDWAWRCLFSCKSYSIKQHVDASAHHNSTTIPQNNRPLHRRPSTAPAPKSVLIARMCQTHPPHSTHPTRAPRALPGRLAAARHTTADDTGRIRQAHSPRPRPHSTLHKASPLTSVIRTALPSSPRNRSRTHKDDHNTHAHKHNAKA